MAWRDHPYHYQGYLFLLKPRPVFKALVNMSSISYPFQRLIYDTVSLGNYTDIKPGMTVILGSSEGADDRGRGRVRLSSEGAATPTNIYVGQFSRGVKDGEFNVADNAHITVLDDYRVWAKIPRITKELIVYKDFQTPYSECEPQPPVANAGVGFAGFIDPDTEIITVDFDGSASFAVAPGSSITGYAWNFGDGTPGSASAAQVQGVTFPTGFRWVSLTVTASNGKTHTARVPVLASDPNASDNGVIRQFRVMEHVCRREGQEITFEVREPINLDDYPSGTLVMYWEREVYAGVAGSLAGPANREHMKFIGWLDEEPTVIEAGEFDTEQRVELRCVDVGGRLSRIPGFPFLLERDSSPTKWHQLRALNIDRFVWFALMWHSTALDLADFIWSGMGDAYAVPALGADEGAMWEQVGQATQAIAHVLSCDRWGRLRMWPDPLLRDPGNRTSVVQESLDGGDIVNVSYAHQRPRVHWLWSGAILARAQDAKNVADVSAVFCVAPGKAPGQGLEATEENRQLVASQSELNAREGHRYATINSDETFLDVELAHGGDAGLDPARLEWIRLTLTASEAAQRGLTFTNERFLPIEMGIEHDHEAQTKRVTLKLEREQVGTPAATHIPPKGEFTQFDFLYPQDYGLDYPAVGQFWMWAGANSIAAFGRKSSLYLTNNFNDTSPTWARVFLNLTGDILAFVVDPFSPGYVGGGGAINGWLVTTNAIYRITNIGPSPSLSVCFNYGFTIDTPGEDVTAVVGADASFGTPNHFVAVVPRNALAMGPAQAIYTRDGISYTAVNLPGAFDESCVRCRPAVYVSPRTPGLVYTSAPYMDCSSAAFYISTTYGKTWARSTSHGPRHPHPTQLRDHGSAVVHVPYHNNPNESDLYYRREFGNNSRLYRLRNGINTEITPVYGGQSTWWQLRTRWGCMTAPLDRTRLAFVGTESWNGKLFLSKNEGDLWVEQGAIRNQVSQVAISGDNPDALYAWGHTWSLGLGFRPRVWYSPDWGATWQDKLGNLASLAPAGETLIGICGGPAS